MKKWQILIPSVMVAATPLTALTACNKGTNIKFKFIKEIHIAETDSTIIRDISWTPTHRLSFLGASFKWNGGEKSATNVTITPGLSKGAAIVEINLNVPLGSEFITDGVLKFKYTDLNDKTGGKWKTIKGIHVSTDD